MASKRIYGGVNMAYTNIEYAEMAVRANREGKILKIVDGDLVLKNVENVVTKERLESEYQSAVSELQKSLAVAQLRNDTALIADIQSDFADLQTAYQAEKEAIENVASTETV